MDTLLVHIDKCIGHVFLFQLYLGSLQHTENNVILILNFRACGFGICILSKSLRWIWNILSSADMWQLTIHESCLKGSDHQMKVYLIWKAHIRDCTFLRSHLIRDTLFKCTKVENWNALEQQRIYCKRFCQQVIHAVKRLSVHHSEPC